ncbi:MAG: hypothetical protein JW893_09620 [Candidatus Omnitrophica bacterium]|nr:hypothetical protein [Candidatus Omnitrophota bacterium]
MKFQQKQDSTKREFFWKEFARALFFLIFIGGLIAAVLFSKTKTKRMAGDKRPDTAAYHFEEILPRFDNRPRETPIYLDGKTIYPVFRLESQEKVVLTEGEVNETRVVTTIRELVGIAFEISAKGYRDDLRLFLGLDMEGKITGIQWLEDHEAPAFSHHIQGQKEFFSSFLGMTKEELLRKDRKEIMTASNQVAIIAKGIAQELLASIDFFEKRKEMIVEKAFQGANLS